MPLTIIDQFLVVGRQPPVDQIHGWKMEILGCVYNSCIKMYLSIAKPCLSILGIFIVWNRVVDNDA